MKVAHPLERQIESAVEKVVRGNPYFTKSEILKEVRSQKALGKIPPQVQEQINLRYVESRIGAHLQARDQYGIRIYENYATGTGERRWMRLRTMTLLQLESVMQSTRTQERDLHVKGEGYEFFVREMKKVGAKKVEDVYAAVAPKVQAHYGRVHAA